MTITMRDDDNALHLQPELIVAPNISFWTSITDITVTINTIKVCSIYAVLIQMFISQDLSKITAWQFQNLFSAVCFTICMLTLNIKFYVINAGFYMTRYINV